MLNRYTFLTIALCILSVISIAQPHKYGCDHWRNLGGKRKPLTLHERTMFNESIARSDTFDIAHYNISIDVTDYSGANIKASTTVSYSPKMDNLDYIRFDLMQMTVDSVTGENVASFDYANDFLDIQFVESPTLGEDYEVTVHYHGEPYQDPTWGGFYFESQYIYNLGIGLTTIPPNFGRVWYPCFDSFVERATYEYHVKSAGTYRAWCQGDFMGEEQLLGDTVIRSFNFDQPIPTHLSAIAVADYVNYEYTHTGAYGEIPVTLRAKPANMSGMQSVFVNLGAAIDACEHWYGPHGWSRVGYVLTTDGALEIPTNIAYPQFMTGQSISDNNGLLSHELGHHWWGDMVTPHVHNDMWMKEGPAEYSSHLMVEWMDGEEAFVEVVKDNQLYVLENAHVDDEGFHPMSPMPDEQIYGRHTYYKGASVVHNLRGYLGDELFRLGMSGVQANHPYEDMTPDQLRIALEEETGYNLQPFFDAQIYLPGFATFVVDSFAAQPNGGNWTTDVFIQQKLRECPAFYQNVPMDLTVIDVQGAREEFQIMADDEFSTVEINSSIAPYIIVLNGHNRLNQNRMDFETWIAPDQAFNSNIPWVDLKLYDENIVDSTFVRVEHIWSAPDDENLGEGIFEISNSHYWSVDGIWPEGTLFEGRINYYGEEEYDLDYSLYSSTEADAVLVYRENSSMPWEVYADFTLTAGNLFSGTGNIKMDILRKGQYAFANGDPSVNLEEEVVDNSELLLFPVPADDQLTISMKTSTTGLVFLDIYNIQGQLIQRSGISVNGDFSKTIETKNLEAGNYLLKVRTLEGKSLGTSSFLIAR